MAQSAEQIAQDYPLPVYHYLVRIGGLPFSFKEVSGLTQQYDTAVYRNGLSFLGGFNVVHGLPQPVNVTLRRGIFRFDYDQPSVLEELAKKALGVVTGLVGGFAGSALNKLTGLLFEEYKFTMSQWMADPKKRDIKVHLIDYSGEAVVTWTLVDALPIKLDAPSLDAEQNAIAIEAIEVVGSELRMEYSKPSQSFF